MSEKRKTQLPKGPLKPLRPTRTTPTRAGASPLLNNTMRPLKRGTTTPNMKCPVNLNATGALYRPGSVPKLKTSATPTPDKEVECDLSYSNYLCALMKQDIISSNIEIHKQDINDQLTIQQDSLHKMKTAYKEAEEEIIHLEQLSKVEEHINEIQKTVNRFHQVAAVTGLEENIVKCLNLLSNASDQLNLKNIEPIGSQEEYDGLMKFIEGCAVSAERIRKSRRNIDKVNALGGSLQKYAELERAVVGNQKDIIKMQKDSAYSLLKNASDMFMAKENYSGTRSGIK